MLLNNSILLFFVKFLSKKFYIKNVNIYSKSNSNFKLCVRFIASLRHLIY